jgi:hypothetical protein
LARTSARGQPATCLFYGAVSGVTPIADPNPPNRLRCADCVEKFPTSSSGPFLRNNDSMMAGQIESSMRPRTLARPHIASKSRSRRFSTKSASSGHVDIGASSLPSQNMSFPRHRSRYKLWINDSPRRRAPFRETPNTTSSNRPGLSATGTACRPGGRPACSVRRQLGQT